MKSRALPLFIISVILIFVGLMLGPVWFAEIEQDNILARGEPATARIIRLTDTGNRYNDNPEVEIELEVKRSNGSVYRTSYTDIISVVDIANYRAGSEVEIKIDRADSLSVTIVGPRDGRSE